MRASDYSGTESHGYSSGYQNYGNSGYVNGQKTDGSWFNKTGGGYKGGGAYRGKGTGGGAASSGTGGYDYASMIAQLYAQQMEAQQAARKAAYDATVTQQNNAYNGSVGTVNQTADKGLQEAYVNRMLSEKNINQQLSAQGLNGGATESTLGGIQNNYGNSRNNIETGRENNLAALANTLQNNLAQAYSAYQSGAAGDYSDYASNLASLYAANAPMALSVVQNSGGTGTPVPKLQALLQQGYSQEDAARIINGGASSGLLNSYQAHLGTY
ncbi:MAG: hypothetical protein RSD27_11350 [Ruthenibacterium sp.]